MLTFAEQSSIFHALCCNSKGLKFIIHVTGVFKSNNPYNTFLLLVYGLLLKLPMFINPVVPMPQQTDGFLFKAFLHQLSGVGKSLPLIYPLVAFLLLFTQAITFNGLVNDQRLMQKSNYLTAMGYLLITSLFAEWNQLSAPLIINTLLKIRIFQSHYLFYLLSPQPGLGCPLSTKKRVQI